MQFKYFFLILHVKKPSDMKYYAPTNQQLSLDLFKSSLDGLDKSNRWVRLGDALPWSKIEKEYNSKLNNKEKGAGNKPARMIIGAMIIKHKLNLSDVETIEIIRENPYMQYFCGFSEFTGDPAFDPSLFVTVRKRLTEEDLNKMVVHLMAEERLRQEKAAVQDDDRPEKGDMPESGPKSEDPDAKAFTDSKGREHKGMLKIDATCADAEVRYPQDVDLIYDGCRKVHEYTAKICAFFSLGKPRTHFKDARSSYQFLVKTSKKKGKMVRSTIGILLGYLHKDLHRLLDILAVDENRYAMLKEYQKRILTAIIKMYHQQDIMYKTNTHSCIDRIISIFQPHVRPIVRGKASAKVEFGAKIGASIVDGYTFIDHHSWDAYNECSDLELQIQLFKERFGYLPATIFADKIYLNRANRKTLKDLEIQTYCKPLGRRPSEPPPEQELAKMAKAPGKRNEIEGSFGTAKRVYRANNIRAKLPNTGDAWTGMCYFVKNVMKFLRKLCHILTEIWSFVSSFTYFCRQKGRSQELAFSYFY